MEIVIDTSALIAVIADEPEADMVLEYSQNAMFVSPNVISFEVTNSLSRMLRKGLINDQGKMVELVKSFQQIPIKLSENNLQNVIQIVWNYKIYAYDAFYLDTAKSLNLPLLTLDKEMKRIGKNFGITILGG
jgi:predicted nucleic acid-binding protein